MGKPSRARAIGLAWGVCLVVVVGCAAPEVVSPETAARLPYASGSRLRAFVRDGGGGARRLLHWQDTELDATCAFALDAAGMWRCVPYSTGASAELVFVDDHCTVAEAVWTPDPMLAPPRFVQDEVLIGSPWAIGCTSPPVVSGVYELDTSRRDPVGAHYVRTADGCVAAPGGAGVLSPATRVDELSLVHATLDVEPGADRLRARAFHASDGAREVYGVYDAAIDGDCWRLGDALDLDDPRCVPMAMAWRSGRYFADSSCSATKVAYNGPGCTPAIIVADDDWASVGCGWRPHLFAVVGSAGVDAYAPNEYGVCAPFHDDGHAFWNVGVQLPADALPSLAHADVGEGRLQAAYGGARADGPALVERMYALEFHDTTLDVDCSATDLGDGVHRCVPFAALGADAAYTDPTCTGPTMPLATRAIPCAAAPPVGYAITTDAAHHARVFHVGVPFTGTAYGTGSGACVAWTVTSGRELVTLGDEVDPATLAVVSDHLE